VTRVKQGISHKEEKSFSKGILNKNRKRRGRTQNALTLHKPFGGCALCEHVSSYSKGSDFLHYVAQLRN